jgi:hypothetical protein
MIPGLVQSIWTGVEIGGAWKVYTPLPSPPIFKICRRVLIRMVIAVFSRLDHIFPIFGFVVLGGVLCVATDKELD